MSTSDLSPLEQLAQMEPEPTQSAQTPNLSPLEQLMQMEPTPSAGGPSPEEQQFLQAHPDYKYLSADPKFPNRPEGIYPTGPGNDWRKDPTAAQSPIDLHFAKHTAEGAAEGAAVAGSALAAPLPAVDAAIAHLGSLTKIVQVARKLGWDAFTIKEAHDLYKMVAGDGKK